MINIRLNFPFSNLFPTIDIHFIIKITNSLFNFNKRFQLSLKMRLYKIKIYIQYIYIYTRDYERK